MAKETEYYGSVKGMPAEILREREKKAERELIEYREEIARREAFSSFEVFADRLHRLLHFGLDCDYYYSDWPNPTGCRAEFKQAAQQILTASDVIPAMAIMEQLRFGK